MTMRTGLGMILDERQRQKVEEGYRMNGGGAAGAERDPDRLLAAATCYAVQPPVGDLYLRGEAPAEWPWPDEAWKPKGPLRNLVRAGALALAADDHAIEQVGHRMGPAVDLIDRCARAIDALLEEVQTDA